MRHEIELKQWRMESAYADNEREIELELAELGYRESTSVKTEGREDDRSFLQHKIAAVWASTRKPTLPISHQKEPPIPMPKLEKNDEQS